MKIVKKKDESIKIIWKYQEDERIGRNYIDISRMRIIENRKKIKKNRGL